MNARRFTHLLYWQAILLLPFYGSGQYVWRHKACLPAPARYNHAPFAVNGKGYMVCGSTTSVVALADVWEYDPNTDTWTQKNNFPSARYGAVPFVINDTAYLCLGKDANGNYFNDCYRYEQASDSWTQMASFPGSPRYSAMSFVINGNAFVGCGKGGGENNDFYEYDPQTNSWSQIASFPGLARQNGYCTAINNLGFVGCGFGDNGVYADGYSYNPSNNTWSAIANFPGPPTDAMGIFTLNDTLYIGGGENFEVEAYSDCWRYDVASNSWLEQEGFGCIAPARFTFFGFVLNAHGYIMCGAASSRTVAYNDLLEFGPLDTAFITRQHIFGNDTTYCGSFSRVLSADDSCAEWSTGYIGSEIAVSSAGTYWAIYDNGCGISVDTIHIYQSSTSSVTISAPETTICPGDSVQICASQGFISYAWSNGDTAMCIQTTYAGNYYVTASQGPNCSATSNEVTINIRTPQPVTVSITGDTLTCYPSLSYQWYLNGNILPGDTNNVLIATQPGSYEVKVLDGNGCYDFSSEIDVTGVNDLSDNSIIVIYPNPATGAVNIKLPQPLITGSKYQVISGDGHIVVMGEITESNLSFSTEDLPAGVYTLRLADAAGNTSNKRFVVMKGR